MWKLFLFAMVFFSGNAYDFSLQSPTGAINLNDYQGKYILVVNTASNSQYATQYVELEQLYQEFKDSLVIIAVPSDDFGNEPLTDTLLQDSLIHSFDLHYVLASKTHITGPSADPLYAWLNSQGDSTGIASSMSGDFEKFLIDKTGNFKGIFAPSISPVSDAMRNAFLPADKRHFLLEGN